MTVIAHVVLEGVSKETYDEVRTKVGWLHDVPAGGMSHVTWWEGDDCHNLDVWESEEAFGRFGEDRLGPAMAALGVTAEMKVTFSEPHEVFLPAAVTITAT